MGYAMLKGAADKFSSDLLTFTDVNKERCEWVKSQVGATFVSDNITCVNTAQYIILAIKPQYLEPVLDEIKEVVTKNHILISIAPGITIQSIKEALGQHIRIVRAMPNTPALVGEGMSAIAYSDDAYSPEERDKIGKFFTSFGKLTEVQENLMDSVVPITGSSPAYVFMFMEALADGAVKLGLSRAQAYEMVGQVVLGSAKMMLETKEHPGVLKDQVCSPGGTTIEAVATLEKNGLRSAVLEAVEDCYKKCQVLSQGK